MHAVSLCLTFTHFLFLNLDPPPAAVAAVACHTLPPQVMRWAAAARLGALSRLLFRRCTLLRERPVTHFPPHTDVFLSLKCFSAK